jgi:flavin reductase (DIM6/NTAB) family NADH-FMN oxidoreductase RutF
MTRKRIGRHLEGGRVPEGEREARQAQEALREVFSRWATGVTLLAVRDEGRVHALTVSAFLPLSVAPPLVAVSLGHNASALPFLDPGVTFGISMLAADQRGLASRYADTLPVGPDPFDPGDPPLVRGCLSSLVCQVEEVRPVGDHHLVTARVVEARAGDSDTALVFFRRVYHSAG